MKRICSLLILTGLAALGTNAQTVTGSGTSGNIAKFTGSSSIGNSVIIENGGNIGIGTTNPLFPLHVTNGTVGSSFPSEVFVETEASDQFSAAIRGLAGRDTNNLTFAIDGVTFSAGGIGVQGNHASAGGAFGGGVKGQTSATSGFNFGVWGAALGTTGSSVGVLATAESPEGTGVSGRATASSGTTLGVLGQTDSDEGIGVLGNRGNSVASGFGGGGVRGVTSAANFIFTYGTSGVATANTGSAVGIFGQAFSPQGVAGLFANVAGGDILRGGVNQPEITVFRVDGNGTVHANGGFRPFGADFAESIAVKGRVEHYAPGDLLVIDASGERRLSLSQSPYSTLVAGIYSTQPGVVASTHRVDEALPNNEVPLAVVGIAPCKVTAENGPIGPGDFLVTSSTPGHAMKGTDRSRMLGAVVGKALEPLQKESGVIQILVTLQ